MHIISINFTFLRNQLVWKIMRPSIAVMLANYQVIDF